MSFSLWPFNAAHGLVHPESYRINIENIFPITSIEKMLTGSDAILTGLTIISFFSTCLWYFFTPDKIMTYANIAFLTGMGILSALLALPLAIITYKNLMRESKTLHYSLLQELQLSKKNQESLFFKLISLRTLYSTDLDFILHLKMECLETEEIDLEKLLIFVNHMYAELKTSQPIYFERDLVFSPNEKVQKNVLSFLKKTQDHFEKKLSACFKSFSHKKRRYSKAVIYGLLGGMSIIGIALGAGLTFSFLVNPNGFTNSISQGWFTFIISCLTGGFLFGVGIGLVKLKQQLREALKDDLRVRNHFLLSMVEKINQLSLQSFREQFKLQAKTWMTEQRTIQRRKI